MLWLMLLYLMLMLLLLLYAGGADHWQGRHDHQGHSSAHTHPHPNTPSCRPQHTATSQNHQVHFQVLYESCKRSKNCFFNSFIKRPNNCGCCVPFFFRWKFGRDSRGSTQCKVLNLILFANMLINKREIAHSFFPCCNESRRYEIEMILSGQINTAHYGQQSQHSNSASSWGQQAAQPQQATNSLIYMHSIL